MFRYTVTLNRSFSGHEREDEGAELQKKSNKIVGPAKSVIPARMGADEEGGGVVVDSAFIFRFGFMSFMVDEFQSSSGFDKRKCTYCEQQTHIQRVVDGTSFFLPPPHFFLSFYSFN